MGRRYASGIEHADRLVEHADITGAQVGVREQVLERGVRCGAERVGEVDQQLAPDRRLARHAGRAQARAGEGLEQRRVLAADEDLRLGGDARVQRREQLAVEHDTHRHHGHARQPLADQPQPADAVERRDQGAVGGNRSELVEQRPKLRILHAEHDVAHAFEIQRGGQWRFRHHEGGAPAEHVIDAYLFDGLERSQILLAHIKTQGAARRRHGVGGEDGADCAGTDEQHHEQS
jgi:hypothetical protein